MSKLFFKQNKIRKRIAHTFFSFKAEKNGTKVRCASWDLSRNKAIAKKTSAYAIISTLLNIDRAQKNASKKSIANLKVCHKLNKKENNIPFGANKSHTPNDWFINQKILPMLRLEHFQLHFKLFKVFMSFFQYFPCCIGFLRWPEIKREKERQRDTQRGEQMWP